MNNDFQPPFEHRYVFTLFTSGSMKTVPKTVLGRMLDAGSAANADQLDEMSHDGSLFTDTSAIETKSLDATGGWDSYDVWRRFIKEARDHRKGRIDPS